MKDGRPTGTLVNIRYAIRLLRENYGHTLAADFGPLALKPSAARMIEAGACRVGTSTATSTASGEYSNGRSPRNCCTRRYIQALATVAACARGRTEAREAPPVRPVDEATVEATLPHLPPIVADMVRFQQLTGCRPGEVCHAPPVRRGHRRPKSGATCPSPTRPSTTAASG